MQLQKIEKKLKKTGDENLIKKYDSIFSELKRLDRIFYKVRIKKNNSEIIHLLRYGNPTKNNPFSVFILEFGWCAVRSFSHENGSI